MKITKQYLTRATLAIIMMISSFSLCAQNYTWVKKASLPEANYQAASFTIANKVYVVSGVLNNTTNPLILSHHVWQYDPTTNAWVQMNDFPGTAVFGASSFVIGNYGYVVNGWDSSNSTSGPPDCWQYDPSTDTWATMAPFPGSTRYTASAFAINGKGYVTLGFRPYVDDTWEFDPVADTWTQKSNFPGGPRQSCTCFTIGNYAYIGGGTPVAYGSSIYFDNDWYRYDPSTDTWTQLNYFPGTAQLSEGTFVVDSNAYVVCGITEDQYDLANGASNDIWKYNPIGDSWAYWGNFPDTAILGGDHVTCNNMGYFGQGEHYVLGTYSQVWWSFGQSTGPFSCAATISRFAINNATSNFQAGGSFAPSASLNWSFGDGSSGTGTSVIHQYASAGTYIVTLTVIDSTDTCSASVNDTITISNISNCSVTVSSVNIAANYTLYANSAGDGPYTYVWSSPTDTSFNSTAPDPAVILQANAPATYCVTVTDTTGCSASACDTITYLPAPDSCSTYIYVYPDSNIPGLYYAVIYHTGATPVSYYWTFGDGGYSTDSFPDYTYSGAGYFDICLTITDSLGCVSSFCDTLFYAYKTGGGEIRELDVKGFGNVATGIQTISPQSAVSVYPNPASTELTISAAGLPVDEAFIYNVDGQRINAIEAPANNRIDISKLAEGVYFMQLKVQGQTARVKFVKID